MNRSDPVRALPPSIIPSAGLLSLPGGFWRDRKPPSLRGPNICASARCPAATMAIESASPIPNRVTLIYLLSGGCPLLGYRPLLQDTTRKPPRALRQRHKPPNFCERRILAVQVQIVISALFLSVGWRCSHGACPRDPARRLGRWPPRRAFHANLVGHETRWHVVACKARNRTFPIPDLRSTSGVSVNHLGPQAGSRKIAGHGGCAYNVSQTRRFGLAH